MSPFLIGAIVVVGIAIVVFVIVKIVKRNK